MSYEIRWADLDANGHVRYSAYIDATADLRYRFFIALPATFRAQQLEWVDLDLDYRVHLNSSIELLDQADLEHNTQHLRYPPDVIAQAWAACREVEAGLAHGTFPFDYDQQVELYHRLKAELHAD